jgi:hypothetical protein
MGKKNTTLERRAGRSWLMLHSAFFVVCWALAFNTLANFPPYQSDRTLPLILLIWTPFLIAHVAAYFRYAAHPDSVELERQAYREGFADGLRDRAKMDDPYDSRHLTIDDEGELIEDMPASNKRKRELQ